jgi:hypothetical protein
MGLGLNRSKSVDIIKLHNCHFLAPADHRKVGSARPIGSEAIVRSLIDVIDTTAAKKIRVTSKASDWKWPRTATVGGRMD